MTRFDPAKIASEYGLSVDEVRNRWLTLRVAYWKSDFKRFAREAVRIRTKEGELQPLVLNNAQNILHEAGEKMLNDDGWVRIAGLKSRRQGYSTYVAARGFWRATLWDRQKIYILSHEMNSSNALFDMVALMQEKHPFPSAVGADNAKELEFKQRGSSYSVATAGQKAGGRGSAVSYMHASECGWWVNAEDHFSASVQAVDEVRGRKGILWTRPRNPLPFEAAAPEQIEGWVRAPSEIWLETTSAGPSGTFYHRYMDAMKGIGRYRHVFVPWHIQAEYTEAGEFVASAESDEDGEMPEQEYQTVYGLSDGQMLWRRNKIHELGSYGKMRQEFPSDIIEAFSAADTDGVFIKPALILKARKRSLGTPDAPLLIGVDPAGAGGDRFAMAGRRGDKCLWVRHRNKLEHDEAVAWICKVIDEERPSKVIIDRGSMGGNIISSLRALGPQYADVIKGVDFGGKSNAKLAVPNRSGPWNRRAEIWGKLRDWLATAVIPDDDDLASDLSAPKIKYRANNDWLLESKTEMKARGIRSPDLGDSLALTFGTQEYFENWSKPDQTTGFATGHEPATIHIDQRKEDSFSSGGGSTYGWMG